MRWATSSSARRSDRALDCSHDPDPRGRPDPAAGTPPRHRHPRTQVGRAARPQAGRGGRRGRHHPAGVHRGGRRWGAHRRRRQLAHRPGLGHRRRVRRQRRPGGRPQRCTTRSHAFTHTCFMVTPYAGYVEVCEALARADPGRPREEERAVQLRRRGRRERRQDRPRRHRPGRGRRLRPRLPRPHEPHDGDDGEEHAVQERLRAVRLRGLPRADVLPVPRRALRRGGGRPRHRPPRQAGRRGQPRLRRDRADPGRGRVHRAGARLPAGPVRLGDRERHRVRRRRDPVRLLPHRLVVRRRPRGRRARPGHHRQGDRRRPAARRRHRPRRADGLGPRRRARRHLRRQPGRLRGRAGLDRRDEGARAGRRGPWRSAP